MKQVTCVEAGRRGGSKTSDKKKLSSARNLALARAKKAERAANATAPTLNGVAPLVVVERH